MGTTLAEHLGLLDEASLVDLLRRRPDACALPVPRTLDRLAERLSSRSSLARVLPLLDRDTLEVGRAIAVLGDRAGVHTVAGLLDADLELVRRPVQVLLDHAIAWSDSSGDPDDSPDRAVLHLPEAVAAHWQAEIGGHEPIGRLARHVLADELRRVAVASGLEVAGLRKEEVSQALHDAWSTGGLADRVAALPPATRRELAELSAVGLVPASGAVHRRLAEAGLLVHMQGGLAVPREVAVTVWRLEAELTSVPTIPPVPDAGGCIDEAAEAAGHEWLRLVVTVLDEADARPIPMLKDGGIGKRERGRLVKRLGLPGDDATCLVIDLATAAGLLAASDGAFRPTDAYPTWREHDAALRWAALARVWFDLEHSPTFREAEGKEVAPPKPLDTTDGWIRRALLRAAGEGSLRAAAEHLPWLCPMSGCDGDVLARVVQAVLGEAGCLGVVVGDAVSSLGRTLTGADDVSAIADAAARYLADPPGDVVLQSDLTAVVSGHPSACVTHLLDQAAKAESRGAATTYRFSPASVRAAFDAGWDADGLLGALRDLSARALPQPLEYLVHDVARRYGEVRVRAAASCLVVAESLVEELTRARALCGLGLMRVAPTVLVSPKTPGEVLKTLRVAGYFPDHDATSGAVVVERPAAATGDTDPTPGALPADELAKRLLTADAAADLAHSATAHALAELNPRLDAAELDLLADAVDHEHPVEIAYRDNNGRITRRTVTPQQLLHRWLVAWCHLRRAQREFTVASILEVAPVRRATGSIGEAAPGSVR